MPTTLLARHATVDGVRIIVLRLLVDEIRPLLITVSTPCRRSAPAGSLLLSGFPCVPFLATDLAPVSSGEPLLVAVRLTAASLRGRSGKARKLAAGVARPRAASGSVVSLPSRPGDLTDVDFPDDGSNRGVGPVLWSRSTDRRYAPPTINGAHGRSPGPRGEIRFYRRVRHAPHALPTAQHTAKCAGASPSARSPTPTRPAQTSPYRSHQWPAWMHRILTPSVARTQALMRGDSRLSPRSQFRERPASDPPHRLNGRAPPPNRQRD